MNPGNISKEKKQRLISWLHNHKIRIVLILFLYPNIVCFTPEPSDSSNTFIEFLMGLGRYSNVLYKCDNADRVINYTYFDYGGTISHKIDNFKFGFRGGGFSLSTIEVVKPSYPGQTVSSFEGSTFQYLNPFIAFDHQVIELSFGLVFLTKYPWQENISNKFINDGTTQFSWLLRLGNKQSFHFSSQYLNNVPIFSGGGMFDMGVGFGSKESRNLTWIGLSVGPFQNVGLGLKQHIQLLNSFDILIKGRIGQIESQLEGSISAGVRYNF
jgi:hypothetical protein